MKVHSIPFLFTYTGEMTEVNLAGQAYTLTLEYQGFDLALGTAAIPVSSQQETALTATFAFSTNSVVTGRHSCIPVSSALPWWRER